jgi:Transglutaminase-like superfamily
MSTTRYYLSPNMYVCVADDYVVLLDLRRDKYLALDTDISSVLRPHVGLLSSQEGVCPSDGEPGLGTALAQLAANKLLCTAHASRGRSELPHPFTRPDNAIVPRPPFREHVGVRHATRYVASVVRAKSALRMRSLYRIVLTERRKAIVLPTGGRTFDPTRATVLCSVYSRLRVIATGPAQCLFDSLALKLFLATYGVFPDWIFGVRLNPFAAHCWLQLGDTVVNDSLDSVRWFTPIMAV